MTATASQLSGTVKRLGRGRLQAPTAKPTRTAGPTQGASRTPSQLECERVHLVQARAGDHPSIYRFLLSVGQSPAASEFQAQLDYPGYQPSNRLLIRRGEQLLGHLGLLRSRITMQQLELPVLQLTDLALLPEYCLPGYASALLQAAEQLALRQPAVLGLVRTTAPKFFQRRGFVPYAAHCYSVAGAREILSQLAAANVDPPVLPLGRQRAAQPLNIRLWRHVEQGALMRLYELNLPPACGAVLRDAALWRWLINRHGYERIYVAIEGKDKLELDQQMTSIVGYAVAKDGRILELMIDPAHSAAAQQLLARACGDAIERGFHAVRLDAPPQHWLHEIFQAARGTCQLGAVDQGQVLMVKLFEPLRFLLQIRERLQQRARAAGLLPVARLGLLIDRQKYTLHIDRRRARLTQGQVGRSYIECGGSEFTQLLLGTLDIQEAIQQGRLTASTRVALETTEILFPRLPLWQPPWDGTEAID